MNQQEFEHLYLEELDGLLDEQTSAALHAYMDAHPASKQMYEEARLMRRLMQRFLPAQEPPASLDQRILAAAQRAAEQRQSQKRPLPSEKKGWLAWLESFLLAPSVRPLLAFCMLALVVGTSYFLQKDEPWFQAQKTGTPNSGIDLLRDIPLGQARSTDKQKSQKKQAIGSLSQKKPARRAPRTRSAAPRSGLTRSVAPRSAPKQDTRLRDKRESPNEGAKANREKAILDNVAREKARRQELRTRRLRRRRKRKRKNAKVSPRRRSRTLFKGRRQKSLRPPLPRSTRKAPPPKGYSFGTRGDIIQKDPEKPKPRQPAGWTSPRRAPQSMTKAPKPAARPSAPAARPAPAPLARQTKGAGAGGRSGFAIGGANAPAAPAPSDDDFAPKKQSSGGFAVPPPPARKRQDEPTLRFAKPSVPPPLLVQLRQAPLLLHPEGEAEDVTATASPDKRLHLASANRSNETSPVTSAPWSLSTAHKRQSTTEP